MWQLFIDFISKICVPDAAALEAAQQVFTTVSIRKGAYFIREGEICTSMGFIGHGLCRSFYVNEKGEEVTRCFAKEGEMETSFQSFISGEPSRLSIIAMEDTTLLEINKRSLDELLDKYLFWNQFTRVLIAREYLKMTQQAEDSKTDSAIIKYRKILELEPDLLQRVPLHCIASYLGISSRHLTRMRKAVTLH
ncbi:Crp/Fnr family transcriptional regulator [Spirosoma sp.]|uniref:Crp/Fnr family transcriptional regulator n=1 Tax=Spirosoma sp. TaxID=1899569 RepID=UPI003B3A7526